MQSFFQKILSLTLIFSLLFGITIRVPLEYVFYSQSFAEGKDFYNLVSIIVDEDTYDETKSKIIRYSRDIQGVLENTRAIILPTPSDASIIDIASLNESLYLKGYKGLDSGVDYESRLVGTVLIGNIPLPNVYDHGNISSTLLPYIDFVDKAYIYNHSAKRYEKNEESGSKLIPEIWHGVISPNTGDRNDDIEAINDYFDKNHDFYTGGGIFNQDLGVIDGQNTPEPSDYEPQVFYYDQFREVSGLQYEKYVGYRSYLENIEDITYNRYSKELANRISSDVLGVQNQTIADLIKNVDPSLDISAISQGPDANASSDILTRYITDNTTKKFLEIFNGSTLSDMRKHVYNAGRYNDGGSRVNMDTPPFLISVLDQVSSEVIKNVNGVLENEITDIVTNGLARDIAIPVDMSRRGGANVSCLDTYHNYYYGQIGRDITNASQCSIYRGSTSNSGTLVEANRGYNINNVGPDTALCGQGMQYDSTNLRVSAGLSGFWGNNSPVNLDSNGGSYNDFDLGPKNLKGGIRPVFDILGSKQITDASKISSPINCFNEPVMLQTYDSFEASYTTGGEESETIYFCRLRYDLALDESETTKYYVNYPSQSAVEGIEGSPAGTTSVSRFCAANNVVSSSAVSFDQAYKNGLTAESCTSSTATLDGNVFASAVDPNINATTGPDGDETPVCPIKRSKSFSYKKISSHILHTSPTDSEFGSQVNSLFTPSLPIDTDRYIDFIGANGLGANYGYRRIDFPQLFRVDIPSGTEVTLENTDTLLQNYLDTISSQINSVIKNSDPSSLSGDDLEIYNLLRTGDFPSTPIDLYEYLQSKPLETYSESGQSKTVSYYDTLVFSVFWNNLSNISAKYKFIFENYLSNQFTGNEYSFVLPKAKKSYEIGYFAAPGDSQNMYIKLDPESKGTHPYADIISANLALQTTLLAASPADPYEIEGTFECAPPDGVNIFQWIPAIICWLKEMLPPTIKIGPGACGPDIFFTEEEKEQIEKCSRDENKNGIGDCLEEYLIGGRLDLTADQKRYYYNSSGFLQLQVFTSSGELARFDSNSYVLTELTKVEIPDDPELPFSADNTKTIYDRDTLGLNSEEDYENAQRYVAYTPNNNRVSAGEQYIYFYLKNTDANIYFESSLRHSDMDGNVVIDLTSNEEKVEVRGERLFVNTYNVTDDGSDPRAHVKASNESNICIADLSTNTIETHIDDARDISSAEEKLLLLIENYSLSGHQLELNYPMNITLVKDGEVVYKDPSVTKDTLENVFPVFSASKSGDYELRVTDGVGFTTSRVLTVESDTATSINPIISTSLAETGNNISTHLFTVEDQFGNLANREIYTVDIDISGGGMVFTDNNSPTISYNIIDGYKPFRLKTTDTASSNTLTFVLRDISGNIIDSQTRNIRTISEIDLRFSKLGSDPVVGGEAVPYKLEFTDASGNILTDLNSRVYTNIDDIFGRTLEAYSEVNNGISQIEIIPATLAGRNIPLELQIEGGNSIYNETITILPEVPIRIDLSLSKDKIEAEVGKTTGLQATLKDIYNNDVFTDSSTEIELEFAPKSSEILTSSVKKKTVIEGKTDFVIEATNNPGIGYFKVSSLPDLSSNSVSLPGQRPFEKSDLVIPTMKTGSGELTETGRGFFTEYGTDKFISKFTTKTRLESSDAYEALPDILKPQISNFWDATNALEIRGIGENAGSIETFFFWDKESIEDNSYNNIYTMMLGASYGDISQKDYLAGSLLFDPENNALASTSLIQSPYTYDDVFAFHGDGKYETQQNYNLTQDISSLVNIDSDGRLTLTLTNEALSEYIGKAYYNLSDASNVLLSLYRNSGFTAEEFDGGSIRVRTSEGKKVFEVLKSGRFKNYAGTTLAIKENHFGSGLALLLSYAGETIGEILIEEENLQTNVSRQESLIEPKLSTLDDTIVIYLHSESYSTRTIQTPDDLKILQVYYHDPFATKNTLNDFHDNDTLGIEASLRDEGIGWRESNTILLSLASGENVGEATKNFHSFSLINLGDPVVSLKALKDTFPGTSEEKSFDSTVGELIAADDTMIDFEVFDYNNDSKKDLITIHTDGYIKLYESRDIRERFVFHGSYAFASDGGNARNVLAGDFSGDGYGDIFFVSEEGKPELLNNNLKDIYRFHVEENFALSGSIIQAEVYDMDADGKDDIVTLDDTGAIHIFYGGGTPANPSFTKNYIGDGYSIEISDTEIQHGGAIYFDGLTQISESEGLAILQNSEDYLQDYNDAVEEGGEGYTPPEAEFIDESLVNSFLYVQVPYTPTNVSDDMVMQEGFGEQVESIAESSPEINLGNSTGELGDFIANYDDYITYSGFENSYNRNTYFLRSQYADTQDIVISKTFRDTTPPLLQNGDTIYLDIRIANSGSTLKNNIAYIDRIPEFFTFASDEFEVLTEDGRKIPRKYGVGEYNIVIDGLSLAPGEETIVRFELETLPLSYGHIEVGLFEEGELGDDPYGDVIVKKDHTNCGGITDIFRSTAIRSYEKGTTEPVCDSDALDIGNTFPELSDENDNGVPDYLETLLETDANGNIVPSSDTDALEAYAEQALNDFANDSDNDGIPDSDDSAPNTDSASDFMGALANINGAIDDIASDIDTLIEGLSCGFGGGACIANPLNWAPLAPGNDPTLFGMPIGDGLHVNEGHPIFSALTGRQTTCGKSPCCLPSVYPATSQAFIPGPFCGAPSAGGSLGTWAPTNFVRLFVTPTLTGGVGLAACFGGPAIVAGNSNPIGVHPVVPGGNCIVAAMPLLGCEGGEGDPGVTGYPVDGGDFGVIHANCDGTKSKDLASPREIETQFVIDYLEYLRSGAQPAGFYDDYVDIFSGVSQTDSGNYYLPTEPLISINGGGEGSMSASVSLDSSALGSGNFADAIQVTNTRIAGFPGFMMDWVERQLDEITSKLTNLPKIFVILPDFGGIFDYSWDDFPNGVTEAFNEGRQESDTSRAENQSTINSLQAQKNSLDCAGDDMLRCRTIDLQITQANASKYTNSGKETLSGIKEVYEFLGNIPLVNVETETINISVPWIDANELDRYIIDWKYSLESYKEEVQDASESWSLGGTCTGTDAEIARCQQQNSINEQLYLDANAFIASLEANIQILEEYKEFPDRLADLINIKEVWLEQILCNIEAISSLMGEWISSNGERFKAWVELYILIKAILKSWQLFIDVFTGYEEQCHECKNERQDLQNFTFQLISAVIPSPPIIEFPKWPDIILDLHNIRAGMNVYLPDFQLDLRPIVLPTLPSLSLPRVPKAGVTLPELPLLPRFEIPELPELPSLPSVELPDLPPPPKIPALFGAVEGVLNIMKLVTKVMCILKNSPFVPEWRAGDQIAFLTERNGYLPTDFINIRPPAFSYSMISAIKVTTLINFEFEMEFILEAVRAVTAPIDDATNNIVNMFDLQISDMNFSEAGPEDINIDLGAQSIDSKEDFLISLKDNPYKVEMLAILIAKKFDDLLNFTAKNTDKTLTNKEFIIQVQNDLAKKHIAGDRNTKELRDTWTSVQNLSFSKEEALIQELRENSNKKFTTLEEIISTEIEMTKELQNTIRNFEALDSVTKVSKNNLLKEDMYDEMMQEFNLQTIDSAIAMITGPGDEHKAFESDIKKSGADMMQRVSQNLKNYKEQQLLAATSPNLPDTNGGVGGSCVSSGAYEYVYEGIYIKEDGKNYKLFDYTDTLSGYEEPYIVDIDTDGDNDIFYLTNGKLYLKENRSNTNPKTYISAPTILKSSNNKFFNGDTYYEAINGFKEANVSDGAINIEFLKPTNPEIDTFRLVYHTMVDRYIDDGENLPNYMQTHVVDGIDRNDFEDPVDESDSYAIYSNDVVLAYVGAMSDLTLTTEKLINLKDDMLANKDVTLTANTKVYSGANPFSIEIKLQNQSESEVINVPAYSHIVFDQITNVISLSGDAYVSLNIFEDIEGTDILDYIGLPILFDTRFEYDGNTALLNASSHIDIRFEDGSETKVDMREVQSYRMYDLSNTFGDIYSIRLAVPNDYYYARVEAIKDNFVSTKSRQILLAPQSYSDTLAPQINFTQKIRIPVYQAQTVDFTDYIYEDGGTAGITDIRVDFDTSVDSDSDGDPLNDRDSEGIQIQKTSSSFKIRFGSYDTLFSRDILIALTDNNGNVGTQSIPFEVYAPTPQIQEVEGPLVYGKISEDLADEPVRIYRYRGGSLAKLQQTDSSSLTMTSGSGSYGFETTETASGLTLSYSGKTLANIDEFTGKIDVQDVFTSIQVLPSNNPLNTSIYPEIQVRMAGNPIFSQHIQLSDEPTQIVEDISVGDEIGSYLQIQNQTNYGAYVVPLSAPYNPGSTAIYRNSDTSKAAIMNIFSDGRIHIDEANYRLEYRNYEENISLVLVEASSSEDVATLLLKTDASYILK